nr:Osmosensitive K+ channel histidine kinase KdpD [Raoultella sp. NCTC 9187]
MPCAKLALRRTADRSMSRMRAWRDRQGQEKVWHTRDAILLCIGHNTGSEKLVRAAARLAARLGSIWHAVYVETPSLHRLPEAKRRAILAALRLARSWARRPPPCPILRKRKGGFALRPGA